MIGLLRTPFHIAGLRKWTLPASLVLGSMMLIMFGVMLVSARSLAWERAEQEATNVKQSVTGEIRSQLELYSSLLDIAGNLLSGPESSRPSQDVILATLRRMIRDSEFAGIIVVLNKEGMSILDSNGRVDQKDSFSDRAYFQVHRDRADVGLYVSQPYRSRLRNDDPSFAISRRIADGDGNFAGVIVAAVRLEHFRKMFSRINLGVDSALSLVNTDGIVLMRHPSADGQGDVGRDVSSGPSFRRARAGASASHVAVGTIDGIERLVSFGRVEPFPLLVNVSIATREILKDWWRQAVVVSGISLAVCSAISLLAFGLQRKIGELDATRQALFLAASTDQLTGLANRREFESMIGREWQRAMRSRSPLSVLMIDADHFKAVNDEFGHAEGDEVLKTLALSIRDSLNRAGDAAARYGGEEFAVVLPNTDAGGALTVAEAVRKAVLAASDAARREGRAGVTVSVGAASTMPTSVGSLEGLIQAADRALYEAKRRGRNQSWMLEQAHGTVVPLRPVSRA